MEKILEVTTPSRKWCVEDEEGDWWNAEVAWTCSFRKKRVVIRVEPEETQDYAWDNKSKTRRSVSY